jgi:exodeoxyribonuclease VII small subunit
MTQPESKDIKYEDALKRLEKLVTELDRSELDLETRLKKFEEGTKLARVLLKKLDQAKKKVEILVKTQVGDAALVPFDNELETDQQA